MKTRLILMAAVGVLGAFAQVACANVDSLTVVVTSISEISEGKLTISFIPKGAPDTGLKDVESKPITVHIRYKPRNLSLPVTELEHAEGMRFLGAHATSGSEIHIMRTSAKGYLPIKGKAGHFRCDAVKVVEYGGKPKTILFVHSNDSDVSRD